MGFRVRLVTLFGEGTFRVRLLLMFRVEFRDRFGGGCVAHSTSWSFWWDVSWVLLGCLLGVSCVSLGCPVYPWVSLGVSWVLLGCLLGISCVSLGGLYVSLCAPGFLGCLLGASINLRGFIFSIFRVGGWEMYLSNLEHFR